MREEVAQVTGRVGPAQAVQVDDHRLAFHQQKLIRPESPVARDERAFLEPGVQEPPNGLEELGQEGGLHAPERCGGGAQIARVVDQAARRSGLAPGGVQGRERRTG